VSHAAVPEQPPSWEVVIERGKIREFADAMQSDSPAFRGDSPVIPPTFLITAACWAPPGSRVDVGFDRARVLHGEQEFRFTGALPRAGDVLQASERLAKRYEKQGSRGGTMRFAMVITEFRDSQGQLVAEASCTMIERSPERGAG
jgi:N-terminal half of MaoC dehydratase